MNKTKILALIFVPFGSFLSIVSIFSNREILEEIYQQMGIYNINLTPFTIISVSITVILFIIAMTNLIRNKKHIAVGILLLLFSNLLSGIFYLIWRVEDERSYSELGQTVSSVSWICPNCGRKNYYNEVCECGTDKPIELKPNKEKTICPDCLSENDKDAIYCSKCGKKL